MSKWHGHIVRNTDNSLARCGGPGLCQHCNSEQRLRKTGALDGDAWKIWVTRDARDAVLDAYRHDVIDHKTMVEILEQQEKWRYEQHEEYWKKKLASIST